MNEVQEKIQELRDKGWTVAALADELGVRSMTLHRWVSGNRHPTNVKLLTMGLDNLLKRKRIPKKRRYTPGSRWGIREDVD